MLPEVAVTVMLDEPAAAEELTARVSEEDPAPVMDTGENVAVTPEGMPVAVRPMTEWNPPTALSVTVERAEEPCATVRAAVDVATAKLGAGDTIKVHFTVCVMLPDEPVTVIG